MTNSRPRLCITTDIGGDPDDTQSLIRLLTYSNEFRIEGLLPTAAGTLHELKDAMPRPDIIHSLIDAYSQVLPNLQRHATGWPEPDALRAMVHQGQSNRGINAVGPGQDTPASQHIIKCVDAGSAEDPLNISIWGGQTDLAQALWRVTQERGPEGLAAFAAKMRIYDIADQDELAQHIHDQIPGVTYILSIAPPGEDRRKATFRGMYLTGDESTTSIEWIKEHVCASGPLGALYPLYAWTDPNSHSCLKEGDTPSWFFFLPRGGNCPKDPSQPGWGGQFRLAEDGFWRDLPLDGDVDPRTTVSRYRPTFQAEFSERIGWCRQS